MKVIPFEEKYRQDFIDFNTDWIVSKPSCHTFGTTINETMQAIGY